MSSLSKDIQDGLLTADDVVTSTSPVPDDRKDVIYFCVIDAAGAKKWRVVPLPECYEDAKASASRFYRSSGQRGNTDDIELLAGFEHEGKVEWAELEIGYWGKVVAPGSKILVRVSVDSQQHHESGPLFMGTGAIARISGNQFSIDNGTKSAIIVPETLLEFQEWMFGVFRHDWMFRHSCAENLPIHMVLEDTYKSMTDGKYPMHGLARIRGESQWTAIMNDYRRLGKKPDFICIIW